ncbi:MAG: Polyphosphate glucokinase, partial [uncultured Nocardioidaceae bacterium]
DQVLSSARDRHRRQRDQGSAGRPRQGCDGSRPAPDSDAQSVHSPGCRRRGRRDCRPLRQERRRPGRGHDAVGCDPRSGTYGRQHRPVLDRHRRAGAAHRTARASGGRRERRRRRGSRGAALRGSPQRRRAGPAGHPGNRYRFSAAAQRSADPEQRAGPPGAGRSGRRDPGLVQGAGGRRPVLGGLGRAAAALLRPRRGLAVAGPHRGGWRRLQARQALPSAPTPASTDRCSPAGQPRWGHRGGLAGCQPV